VRLCLKVKCCLLRWCLNHLSDSSVIGQNMWPTNLWFSVDGLFSPLSFSLLLDFHAWPSIFSRQHFNLFFLHIWSLMFWLLFVLFEIIYKFWFFFSISSLFNFFICYIWFPLSWWLFILFKIIFLKKNFTISPRLVFFYQIWSFVFWLLFFLLWVFF
jgi:hypothetical protein